MEEILRVLCAIYRARISLSKQTSRVQVIAGCIKSATKTIQIRLQNHIKYQKEVSKWSLRIPLELEPNKSGMGIVEKYF